MPGHEPDPDPLFPYEDLPPPNLDDITLPLADDSERAAGAAEPNGSVEASLAPQDSTAGAAPAGSPMDVPLRELVLVWFESRGYRATPASAVVRPIEAVLRHRADPGRAYGFVVQARRVSLATAEQLLSQAQSIGLMRVLIAAEAGADDAVHATLRRRGVRVLDRAAMQAEMAKIDFALAARIVALAGARARGHPAP
jgi:hypothetical protein